MSDAIVTEWLPIDTAPKNGDIFLGFSANDGRAGMAVIYWQAPWDFCCPLSGVTVRYLTHWRPLPAAPSTNPVESMDVEPTVTYATV